MFEATRDPDGRLRSIRRIADGQKVSVDPSLQAYADFLTWIGEQPTSQRPLGYELIPAGKYFAEESALINFWKRRPDLLHLDHGDGGFRVKGEAIHLNLGPAGYFHFFRVSGVVAECDGVMAPWPDGLRAHPLDVFISSPAAKVARRGGKW